MCFPDFGSTSRLKEKTFMGRIVWDEECGTITRNSFRSSLTMVSNGNGWCDTITSGHGCSFLLPPQECAIRMGKCAMWLYYVYYIIAMFNGRKERALEMRWQPQVLSHIEFRSKMYLDVASFLNGIIVIISWSTHMPKWTRSSILLEYRALVLKTTYWKIPMLSHRNV